ncbi:hypothetical protein ES288_A07G076600v1 [Gossypium darwinii]|uniref:Endonuclease/exonuclease/phosphatase domain-containing protein n=1 Tax=Gossypium darwinii TaxID=34276 RepID=A0A5D2FTW3_GOSDA|nr:hypothetical protein ES288_A07G076600v1 [Gossypium darwinii]
MSGCLAVNSNGRNGGLAMLWRDGIEVIIQSYSNMHIDSMVQMENKNYVLFTGFYGQADPNHRNLSWDMLRRIGRTVKENWIMGGDFNAILDNDKKDGGRRKPRVLTEDFRSVLEELALVDIKTSRGWFTWINNREGDAMVKERLDRFVFSSTACNAFLYIDTNVISQTSPDHEVIMLDTLGKKPKEKKDNPRLFFRFEVCWARDEKAKKIIKDSWCNYSDSILEKMNCICDSLGPWQFNNFNKRKHQINKLSKKLDDFIQAPSTQVNLNRIKETRLKLKKLYEQDEIYWVQRSRIRWLKEGDRNTKFFHVRVTSRRKKNDIERMKDNNGCWVYNNREKCRVARDYIIDLFQTSTNTVNNMDICCIPKCVNDEMNKNLTQSFTDKEILRAFNQMDPRKAPNINGLPGIFFKKN